LTGGENRRWREEMGKGSETEEMRRKEKMKKRRNEGTKIGQRKGQEQSKE